MSQHIRTTGVRRILVRAAVLAAILAAGLVAASPQAGAATGDGAPTDPNIAFVGRWDIRNLAAVVPSWAGSYFATGFTGTTIGLKQRSAIDLYYSIDGAAEVYRTNVSGTITLTPTPLKSGTHTLRVSYRVVAGSYHGDAVFQGLVLSSGAHTVRASLSPKLIEFIGDSITVGTTTSKNALTAYGWLIGERLGTRHTQVAQGGACLVSTADGCVGMEDYFLKLNSSAKAPNWDFSRYQANAVVINLGTNDLAHGTHSTTFQPHFLHLLEEVRAKYPLASIFAVETFSKRFAAQTLAAVQSRHGAGDANVYYVNTEGWLSSGDFTDGVHPTDAGHQIITDHLAPIIVAHLV
jgi:lysophospholipase L1-like esterase